MSTNPNNQPQHGNGANTGNASNPSPETNFAPNENQLLGKEAERYLREAGNIEDLPDAADEKEMDNTIDDNNSA